MKSIAQAGAIVLVIVAMVACVATIGIGGRELMQRVETSLLGQSRLEERIDRLEREVRMAEAEAATAASEAEKAEAEARAVEAQEAIEKAEAEQIRAEADAYVDKRLGAAAADSINRQGRLLVLHSAKEIFASGSRMFCLGNLTGGVLTLVGLYGLAHLLESNRKTENLLESNRNAAQK